MSNNQKQTVTGGPQTQRYSSPVYQPIPQSSRTDGFPVSTPSGSYAPPQGTQGGNQGPGLRTLAPSGPPNQSSTPPNTDIKVPNLPQGSMNHMFVQRPVQAAYYNRSAGPPSQTQRMPNHNNRQQQPIFGTQPSFVVQTPFIMQPPPVSYYPAARQSGYVQPSMPVYPHILNHFSTPSQTPSYYFTPQTMIPRTNSIAQPLPANPNPTQAAIPNVPMVSSTSHHQPFQKQTNRRRSNALAVIDPKTGVDKLAEMFENPNSSHPPSGESSARQTPQPNPAHCKEVQAAFAKQVMQAISNEPEPSVKVVTIDEGDHHNDQQTPPHSFMSSVIQQSPVPVVLGPKMEHLAQSSKLKAMAKEFVCNTAKEPPVVSANCDAVEVTLLNKQPKDRESPVKSRKPREHKDSVKETIIKDSNNEKQSSILKEVDIKPEEIVLSAFNALHLSQAPVPNKDIIKDSNQIHDKRVQRKEVKVESKAPSINLIDNVPLVPVQSQPQPLDVSNNAKSKQNSSRLTNKSGPPQNNNQKTQPATLPQLQPSKASNKSHKKNEINQKGASKEGTDMDAFNDNAVREEPNANVTSVPVSNDIINANPVPAIAELSVPSKDVTVHNETNIRKIERNEVLTIRSEPTKPMKTKIDITDIVRETPKPMIKSFIAASVDSHDETDRVFSSNDKIEVNANKTTSENRIENKLPYRDGQWTPSNPRGSMVYPKDFLLAVKDLPSSKVKPDNIPDAVLADERGRLPDGRLSTSGRADFTNPPFNNNYGGKSGSQRGGVPQRNSKGKMNDSKRQKLPMKVSISVREDVKLHEVENAWRPARLKKGEAVTDDDKKTDDLYKKVRGILNKLTPQKFETLLSQIKGLHIDTASRLQGVIDLVFEKAVDEPNFSVAYANMCRELALMQVPTNNSTPENTEYVNFRKLLITRCQMEFEKQSIDESVRCVKLKEIEECADPEKKKDLQFELEEYDRGLRMKSVGTIRFIGELFKENMLTVNIMVKCLNNLVEVRDEESLECLCKLLTTIGKELETKSVDITHVFTTMKNLADKKRGKVSSRIRFMLQDVIDLRQSKWVPRRQDHNPKTIDQIQREADQEQLNIQMMHSVPINYRRDDRSSSGGGPGQIDRKGGRGSRNASDSDGWISSSRNKSSIINVQSEKLRNAMPEINEPLGKAQMFTSWSKGSVGLTMKSPHQSTGINSANMFAALENMEPEKRNLGVRPGNKDPYNSKGTSLERNYNNNKYDSRGSRSGSQHRSNEGPSSHRSITAPTTAKPFIPPVQPPPPAPVPQLTEEQIQRRIKNSLDEYINDNCTLDEYYEEIAIALPQLDYPRLITDSYLQILEKTEDNMRFKTGGLFAKLIKQGKISLDEYCAGLAEITSQSHDLEIDIPKIWDYLAEIIVDLVCEEVLPLNRLPKSFCDLTCRKHSHYVLAVLFKLIISNKGPNFLQNIWQQSGVQFTDFMDTSAVIPFLKENEFDFLFGCSAQNHTSFEYIQSKLLELFKSKATFDEITNWISVNIGDAVNENKFIRALATAIFQDSIGPNFKLVPDILFNHNILLLKYVDNNPVYELQCLYALQGLIHRMEHPQGLLLQICDKLYELETFPQESFIAWEASTDQAEQEGKGVALKQLTCFFTQMKENEDDDVDVSSESDAA